MPSEAVFVCFLCVCCVGLCACVLIRRKEARGGWFGEKKHNPRVILEHMWSFITFILRVLHATISNRV